jgi:Putative auto-transporter adhesin, head GIN domain
MERAVFYIAIVVAAMFALGALVDGPHVRISGMGEFGHHAEPVIEVKPEQIAERAYVAGESSVRHAAVRLVVIPEAREDFAVEIDNPGKLPSPQVSLENGRLVIDGRLRGRVGDCGDEVEVRGYGDIPIDELPQVRLRTPMNLELRVDSAGPTEIGPSGALDAAFSGCGNAEIGDVAGELKLDLAGGGKLHAGAAQSLDLDSAGSAGATIGAVREGAQVSIAGSGDVAIAALTGALDASTAGSGELEVSGGDVAKADISLAGSGSARIHAPVQKLEVSIVGSGEVDVVGAVGDLDAEIAGSGNVRVSSVTGPVRQRVMGSGQVQIGR